jgi:hypothetical protein
MIVTLFVAYSFFDISLDYYYYYYDEDADDQPYYYFVFFINNGYTLK